MKIFLDANICLDLLDSSRQNHQNSKNWYLENKDKYIDFYFSSDFITTIFYILTEKRKFNPKKVLEVLTIFMEEIEVYYVNHLDFLNAKNDMFELEFNDFEDLFILNSAIRIGCDKFLTNDKKLLNLLNFKNLEIVSTKEYL